MNIPVETVFLTDEEMRQPKNIADRISAAAMAHGATPCMHTDGNEISLCARFAFTKLLGIPWRSPLITSHSANVKHESGLIAGCRVRVRTNKYDCLIVRPNDEDDAEIVLCLAYEPNRFDFVGSIKGKKAKQDKLYNNRLPAPGYEVGQTSLTPITKLLLKLKEQNATAQ